jgi:hypothetical protein
MEGTVADPEEPYLGVRMPGKKAVGSHNGVLSYLECTGFDIDSEDFALVALLHLGTYLALIDFIAASGGLFFAITRMSHCHGVSPFTRAHRVVSALIVL